VKGVSCKEEDGGVSAPPLSKMPDSAAWRPPKLGVTKFTPESA